MSQNSYDDRCLCKKCFIKLNKPSKKEIKRIVLSYNKEQCEYCKRMDFIVEYIEDGD